MKSLFTALLLLSFFCSSSQNKRICITIDDLPTVTYGRAEYAIRFDITEDLVKTLNENRVPAIGYVNERKLYKNGVLDSLEVGHLELWLSSGLELGNHTYSHLNYHKVPFAEFTNDILKGDKVIMDLARKYDTNIEYFRHPYLRIGLRATHADSLKLFLHEHGYIEAPVTIDNADYIFASAYSKAYRNKDSDLMGRIATDYLQYMEDKLVFFESQSMKLFGRHIDQTLLIHANNLNANYLDELIAIYRVHGYTFVSQTEVLKDPAYSAEVTDFGDWGISWIDRWALSRGLRGDFFSGDPETPEYIIELTSRD